MKIIPDIFRMLAFRTPALRMQAERRMLPGSIICFSAGFLAYALVRRHVYAVLPEINSRPEGVIHYILYLNLLQNLVFLLVVYIPVLVVLCRLILGKNPAFNVSPTEYRLHVSVLMPLWGLLFLIAAPLQWAVPHFLVIGMLEISTGFFIRSILAGIYTVWVLKELNFMTTGQALGAFVLSWGTLPLIHFFTY